MAAGSSAATSGEAAAEEAADTTVHVCWPSGNLAVVAGFGRW